MSRLQAVLIGGTGYGGAEILRRLLFHPHVEVARVTAADNIGKKVGDVHFNLAGLTDLTLRADGARARPSPGWTWCSSRCRTRRRPRWCMEILDSGVRIVDLSGDFRLRDPGGLREVLRRRAPRAAARSPTATFTYGMPELNRAAIAQGALHRHARLLRHHHRAGAACRWRRRRLLDGPGAHRRRHRLAPARGANPQLTTHHPLRAANLRTYKPLEHQHIPEILQTLQRAGGARLALEFVPVSAPLPRGIFATSFVGRARRPPPQERARTRCGQDASRASRSSAIVAGPPAGGGRAWRGGNYVEVGFTLGAGRPGTRRAVVCFSALDNLVKGGAGQAIQAST